MSFRASHVRERLNNAVEHLAISNDKLRERVLDAYETYLSVLMPKEFPDQETRQMFKAIEADILAIEERIEQKPGSYASALRNRLRTPLQIARNTLDYRVAGKLARLIVSLYFKVETGVLEEYEREIDAARRPRE
jgi:hypothetical protein